MLDKLQRTLSAIMADLTAVKGDITQIKRLPAPKDGVSPAMADVVAEVLAQMPTPKDGVSPVVEDIVADVLAQIPTPKDGEPGEDADVDAVAFKVFSVMEKPKDGVSPKLADIVAGVLAKMPTPKDGVSPSTDKIVASVLAQIPAPAAAEMVKKARDGKNGVSVTKVKLEKGNKLAVWLDGVRRVVGTIEVPKPAAEFTPAASGGGTRRTIESPLKSTGYTPQGTFNSADLQTGVEDTPSTVTFGAGGTTLGGDATVGVDGVITVNTARFWSIKQRFRAGRDGAAGVSDLFFWAEISTDGGSVWNVLGGSVDIPLSTANDTVVFFDLANIRVPAGTKLRNRFARSSTGDNSGDLRVGAPSAALQAIGVPDAPSAQITFYMIDQ